MWDILVVATNIAVGITLSMSAFILTYDIYGIARQQWSASAQQNWMREEESERLLSQHSRFNDVDSRKSDYYSQCTFGVYICKKLVSCNFRVNS